MRSTERNAPPVSLLSRAAAIVGAFDERDPVLSLGELSRRTGLPKSTVHRIAARAGDPAGAGAPGVGPVGRRLPAGDVAVRARRARARSTGRSPTPRSRSWRTCARRPASASTSPCSTGSTSSTSRSSAPAASTSVSRTGGRLPAHATGVGKAILAYSPAATVQARIDAGLPRLTPRTICTPGGLVRELRKIRSIGMALDLEEAHARRVVRRRTGVRRRPQGGGGAVGHRRHRVDRPGHPRARRCAPRPSP